MPLVYGRKGRPDSRNTVYRIVDINTQTIKVYGVTGRHFNQLKMFFDNRLCPAQATAEFLHRHLVNFDSGNNIDLVGHFHEREH